MLRIVLAAAFLFAPVVGAWAQQKTPKFTDYPAPEQLYQRHPLVLTSKDQNYRTNLKAASIAKANFAGHFVLTIWGCGSVCAEGAVIDLTNGKVVWLPGLSVGRPDSVERGIDGRLNSKLLILAGSLADGEGYPPAMHYYKIENDIFIHIADLPFHPPQP